MNVLKIMKIKKVRLDTWLQQVYPDVSKSYLQSLIMQGKVLVEGKVVTKAGTMVNPDVSIVVDFEQPKYVSRAGWKLEKALEHFNISVRDLVVLDAGLSTGGFADCLLQHGAKKVYGIDVGYGQVHEKIRADARVVVMERKNLRNLEALPEPVDLVTLDLSFISVLKVMDTVIRVLKQDGQLIVLIKPQFEAGKKDVGPGGIVSDPVVHQKVIKNVVDGIESCNFSCVGVIPSPIEGTEGNKEFLAYFIKS